MYVAIFSINVDPYTLSVGFMVNTLEVDEDAPSNDHDICIVGVTNGETSPFEPDIPITFHIESNSTTAEGDIKNNLSL